MTRSSAMCNWTLSKVFGEERSVDLLSSGAIVLSAYTCLTLHIEYAAVYCGLGTSQHDLNIDFVVSYDVPS